MADIFISYARPDSGKIEKLAAALEESGYSVWWDRSIVTGDSFSEVIQRELEQARAVIVAWSEQSLHSDWVKDEAHYAKTHKKYYPIKLDACSPPLGFQQFQTYNLSSWKGNSSDPILKNLIGEIPKETGDRTETASGAVETSVEWKSILNTRSRLYVVAGLFAVLLLGAGLWQWRSAHVDIAEATNAVSKKAPTIAVLPFTFLGEDEDQHYLADGMAAEILHRLAEIEGLRVIGRTSSFSVGENTGDLREIGATLGATHILEGSLQQMGDHIRINAQLVDARTGLGQWTEQFDPKADDFFSMQDEISQSVAKALEIEFIPNADTAFKTNASAYDMYLRALHSWRRRWSNGRENGVALLEEAIALDPSFADARGLLALAYSGELGWKSALSPEKDSVREKTINMAEATLALDPQNAFAHTALGSMRLRERRWADARRHFERAVAFAPEDETPSIYLYRLYQIVGDLGKASAVLETALEFDPVSPNLNGALANNLFLQGDYEGSVKHGQKAYLYESVFGAYSAINSLALLGRREEALAMLRKVANERNLDDEQVALIETFIESFYSDEGREVMIAQARKERFFGYAHLARLHGEFAFADQISSEEVEAGFFEDTLSNLLDMADMWTSLPNEFRKTETFKDLIRRLKIDDYWREFEFSPFCHAVGEDDFACE